MSALIHEFRYLLSRKERFAWLRVSGLALVLFSLLVGAFLYAIVQLGYSGSLFSLLLPALLLVALIATVRAKDAMETRLLNRLYQRFDERLLLQEQLIPTSYPPRVSEPRRYYDTNNNVVNAVVTISRAGHLSCYRAQ